MKECPRHEEINKILKINTTPVVLTGPFPSQQQLIDYTSLDGPSSSTEEIRMMSPETVMLTTQNYTYDKAHEKKDEFPYLEKNPSANRSPPPPSNGLLTINKN